MYHDDSVKVRLCKVFTSVAVDRSLGLNVIIFDSRLCDFRIEARMVETKPKQRSFDKSHFYYSKLSSKKGS